MFSMTVSPFRHQTGIIGSRTFEVRRNRPQECGDPALSHNGNARNYIEIRGVLELGDGLFYASELLHTSHLRSRTNENLTVWRLLLGSVGPPEERNGVGDVRPDRRSQAESAMQSVGERPAPPTGT
jgi:hypothetical protein